MRSFLSCVSENVFVSPSLLGDPFTRSRVLGGSLSPGDSPACLPVGRCWPLAPLFLAPSPMLCCWVSAGGASGACKEVFRDLRPRAFPSFLHLWPGLVVHSEEPSRWCLTSAGHAVLGPRRVTVSVGSGTLCSFSSVCIFVVGVCVTVFGLAGPYRSRVQGVDEPFRAFLVSATVSLILVFPLESRVPVTLPVRLLRPVLPMFPSQPVLHSNSLPDSSRVWVMAESGSDALCLDTGISALPLGRVSCVLWLWCRGPRACVGLPEDPSALLCWRLPSRHRCLVAVGEGSALQPVAKSQTLGAPCPCPGRPTRVFQLPLARPSVP